MLYNSLVVDQPKEYRLQELDNKLKKLGFNNPFFYTGLPIYEYNQKTTRTYIPPPVQKGGVSMIGRMRTQLLHLEL